MIDSKNAINNGSVKHFLNLITQAKGTLAELFEHGTLYETNENASDLRKLIDARVVITTNRGYRLHYQMDALINRFLDREASSFLSTHHYERIAEIEDLVQQYFECKHDSKKSRRLKAKQECERFNRLESVVFEILTDLQDSCKRLSNRINYDFGYASSLEHKKKENELATEQAKKLVSSIKLFNFSWLSELASDNTELNALLCVEMYESIKERQDELTSIISRMRSLLTKYKRREHQRDLVNNFNRFLDLEPTWFPSDEYIFPDVNIANQGRQDFWLCKDMKAMAYPNCNHESDGQIDKLVDIVGKVTASAFTSGDAKNYELEESAICGSVSVIFEEEIEEEKGNINEHCDQFFANAFIEGSASASQYYDQTNAQNVEILEAIECDKESWLMSVVSYHLRMTDDDKKDFVIEHIGKHAYTARVSGKGYGNFYLDDVMIKRRKSWQESSIA